MPCTDTVKRPMHYIGAPTGEQRGANWGGRKERIKIQRSVGPNAAAGEGRRKKAAGEYSRPHSVHREKRPRGWDCETLKMDLTLTPGGPGIGASASASSVKCSSMVSLWFGEEGQWQGVGKKTLSSLLNLFLAQEEGEKKFQVHFSVHNQFGLRDQHTGQQIPKPRAET